MRTDRNFTGRLSFVPVTNLRPEKPNLFISYKMAGLGVVPMAIVFRTPLICPTGLEYSWPEHKQRFILQQLWQQSPVQQRRRLPGQEALCARQLRFYQNYLMRWLCLWQKLIRQIRTFTMRRLQR